MVSKKRTDTYFVLAHRDEENQDTMVAALFNAQPGIKKILILAHNHDQEADLLTTMIEPGSVHQWEVKRATGKAKHCKSTCLKDYKTGLSPELCKQIETKILLL
jgi:hypothetical protein